MEISNSIGPLPAAESLAFCLRLRPGSEDEYRQRHDDIWPEMRAMLHDSGILHYEIHLRREDSLLFAFIVRRPGHSMDAFRENPVWRRWQAHMADILVQDPGGGPLRLPLERVFRLET
ncbi:MAG: L-rhamnose mutarotase [Proteobacteria bacterium]|nr:L-rhamnose mutarotase [Pseudomonadota bacterium]